MDTSLALPMQGNTKGWQIHSYLGQWLVTDGIALAQMMEIASGSVL